MSTSRKSNISNSYKTVPVLTKERGLLHVLYQTKFGRIILWILIRPTFSKIFGSFLNTRISKLGIQRFIHNHDIDMSRFETRKYRSFNDFFSRKLKVMPMVKNDVFTSPCDGKLSVYPISHDLILSIKGSKYTISSLVQDKEIAEYYRGGHCLVFRLTPDDYHRYHFMDQGVILQSKKIKGVLHTVRPIAFLQYQVYKENAREVTVMETEHFGVITQIEVGALMVGKIKNFSKKEFQKGEEKGMFLFGGSTIIMLVSKEQVNFRDDFTDNTKHNLETLVKYNDVLEKS